METIQIQVPTDLAARLRPHYQELVQILEWGLRQVERETGSPQAQVVTERVAQQMRHLASLESVYVKVKPWGFECWLISNHSTEQERFHLYDLEWQLMELAPDDGFKFHLVDRRGRPLSHVLTQEPFDAAITLRKAQDA